jgi:2-haloacid dehalogenase
MIKTILWDVDGTLLNFDKSEYYALNKCLTNIGVTSDDEMIRRYAAINLACWKRLERNEISRDEVLLGRFRDFFKNEGIVCKDAAAFNDAYQYALGEVFYPNDDSVELLKRLRGRVKQYAVTNGSALAQRNKLENSGLALLLDGIFISEAVGVEKPNIEYFEAVFNAIGPVDKSETVIIGDSLTSDIKGGNNAGILCWWYNPKGKENGSGLTVHREIRDLREVEGLI